MSVEAIEAALLAENARYEPPLPEDEVRGVARSVSHYPPGEELAIRWPEPMAEEAFYGLVGDIVRTIEPHTEADRVALLVNTLAYVGNAVGRTVHGVAEADWHGTNLFTVMVGETAKGRKGSSRGHIHELFARVDPVWTHTRTIGGLSSGEGLIWAVRDPIEKTEAIKEKGRHTGEYETVIVDAGVDDKRLLVFEPEFASVLKVMARDGNTLSPVIRQAWDTGHLRTMVKNNPAVATGAHISILGHVTKDELLRYLSATEAGNGFANRFLWFCVQRGQVLPEGGGTPDYNRLVRPLHDALEKAKGMGWLKRDSKAREAWAAIYEDLSDGKPGLFGAVTARAEAQVLRLSVSYAAIDGSEAVRLPHLKAALAVWEYSEASARYIFGDSTGNRTADRIMDALRNGELDRTGISNLFHHHAKTVQIDKALDLLEKEKKACVEHRNTEGRPEEVWKAV
jgi:phage gp37-like protein